MALLHPIRGRAAAPTRGETPGMMQEPPLGSHLATFRLGYSHHGIYVGGGKVIHYAGFCRRGHTGPVEEVSVSRFALGHTVRVIEQTDSHYAREEIVRRARSRMGERHYDLLTNNCEHFCNWCVNGQNRSRQAERPWSGALIACALTLAFIRRLSDQLAAQPVSNSVTTA